MNEFLVALNTVHTKVANNERKVWNIPVNTVLVPFLTVMNLKGHTAISKEALGYPVQLARDTEGNIRHSKKTGKPIMRIAPELSSHVRGLRDNLIASMSATTTEYVTTHENDYNLERQNCIASAKTKFDKDTADILADKAPEPVEA
jgi:hypothetical protein